MTAVCAVCSQYSEKTETLTIDEDTDCLKNLELLWIEEEFIIRQCIIACNSAEFQFQNSKLDGLMLNWQSVENILATKMVVTICSKCKMSLANSKILCRVGDWRQKDTVTINKCTTWMIL